MRLSSFRSYKRPLFLMAGALACMAGTLFARADEPAPKKPPLPKIVSLSVQPAALTLNDSRDARSVIVTGRSRAGYLVDLSPVVCAQLLDISTPDFEVALHVAFIELLLCSPKD